MLTVRHLALFVAVIAGFAAAMAAQTTGQPEEFNAVAIMSNNLGSGSDRVIMRVQRWSTESERARLSEALKKGILAVASQSGEKKLAGFLHTLGFEKVRFVKATMNDAR